MSGIPIDRPWLADALQRIEADARRSADTHLIPLQLAEAPGVDVYWKDESGEDIGISFSVSMEMKGQIESCGDLIRQINFYRKFAGHPD